MTEHDFRRLLDHDPEDRAPGPTGIAPGKRTLTAALPPPLQRRAAATPADAPEARARAPVDGVASHASHAAHEDPFGMHLLDAAAHGVAGAGAALPHLDAIQASFGPRHDVSHVRAHVGGQAARASEAIGAEAYATGDQVAFRGPPDLHTAAHEAAHVVQQRGGVQLKGGVGEAGDVYERHADAVADKVVAGESAAALLDEHAAGGGAHQAVQGAGGFGGMLPPEMRFQRASREEQKRMLAGEHDRKTQLTWLRMIAPDAAIELLVGGDAVELPALHVLVLLEQLPRVLAAMDARDAVRVLGLRPDAPANRRLFERLSFATQLAAWRALSPPERRAEVWPTGGSAELKAALLTSLPDHLVQVLVAGLGSSEVQDIVDYLPAHVVGRVRTACQRRGVHAEVVGAAAASDVDARADQLEADGEAWDAAHRDGKKPGRAVSTDVPDPDAWADMPWMFRVQYFAVAPRFRRVAYLARERERKHALLATIDDARDRADTMAAYVAKYPWAADRLLGDAEPAELVAAVRALDDPEDAGRILVASARHPQKVAMLVVVMAPHELAAALRVADAKALPAVWEALAAALPAATVTSVLRRLSDDELARVERDSNDPDGVARRSPPERRAAGAGGDAAS